MKPSNKVLYFQNIDALRFVLSLLVLVYHVPQISNNLGLPSNGQYAFLQKGFLAVNWFFVLSGFLLSWLAKKEVAANRFSIKKFIARRILRIWPVYFIVTFIGIALYYFVLPYMHIAFENKASLSTTILLSVFFLSNILHRLYDPGGILTVTWSVSIEEQFYLVFPFAVILLFKQKKMRISSMIILLLLIIVIDLVWPTPKGWLEYFDVYVELFLIGILAGELLPYFEQIGSKIKQAMLLLSGLVFIVSFFTGILHSGDHVINRVINGILAAFVILTLCTASYTIRNAILIMGGKISYGIYMYHMIVITAVIFITKTWFFDVAWKNTGITILVINLVSVILTYLCAYISYHTIEKYFLSKKPY